MKPREYGPKDKSSPKGAAEKIYLCIEPRLILNLSRGFVLSAAKNRTAT